MEGKPTAMVSPAGIDAKSGNKRKKTDHTPNNYGTIGEEVESATVKKKIPKKRAQVRDRKERLSTDMGCFLVNYGKW